MTTTTSSNTKYIPINAMTCIPYSPANAEILTAAAEKMNVLDDPRWLTFVQLNDLDLKIKKGAKGTRIEFCPASEGRMPAEYHDDMKEYWDAEDVQAESPFEWEDYEEQVKEYIATRKRPLKDGKATYTVFHASQIEGLPASYGNKKSTRKFLADWLEFIRG